MDSLQLYHDSCLQCSKLVTHNYSTSFSMGIRLFKKEFRDPIYAIYGYVRFADEIVDTFHQHDKSELLDRFERDTFDAIDKGISLNPILQSFQQAVHKYQINHQYIRAFLKSMRMDLTPQDYDEDLYNEYIYGSAEVIGLMCLKVFTYDNPTAFDSLAPAACKLGAAFQKVNFLRDMKSDFQERGRVYFPEVCYQNFNDLQKSEIEKDIAKDFEEGLRGIKKLPEGSKLGVFVAYVYYRNLLQKIMALPPQALAQERVRIPNFKKFYILLKYTVKHRLNMV